MFWLKSRLGRLFEGSAYAVEAAIGFGLASGAAVAVAIGQLLLGGVLAAFAVGAYLRFKRGRVSKQKRREKL